MDPRTRVAVAFAGTGSPSRRDGEAAVACFAQPVALAAQGTVLAVADAQADALRFVDLHERRVWTALAELAQPMAIVAGGSQGWLVAETAKDRVCRLREAAGELEEVAGAAAGLLAPQGLALHQGQLWIADTGHDRVVAIDLQRGSSRTLALEGLTASPGRRAVRCHGTSLRANATVRLRLAGVAASAPLDPEVQPRVLVASQEGQPVRRAVELDARVEEHTLLVDGVPTGDPGEGVLRLRASLTLGAERYGPRWLRTLVRDIPVQLLAGADSEAWIEELG